VTKHTITILTTHYACMAERDLKKDIKIQRELRWQMHVPAEAIGFPIAKCAKALRAVCF